VRRLLPSHRSQSDHLPRVDALFYDVSTRLADVHLSQLGIETEWHDVYVEKDLEEAWEDSRQYFRMEWYKLPICRLAKKGR